MPLVLNVGRVSFKKGLDLLLEAMAGIPDAHVAIVGPDDGDGTYARLEALRARPELAGRVHLLPPFDDRQPRELYGEADVFVLPSRNESFGMVAAEAAAAGTPVVLTDRCGVASLLGEDAAMIVPPEVEPLREAIARVLADAELRARLGAGGRDVARRVSWASVVAAAGRALPARDRVGCADVIDLAVLGPDPRFGGGGAALVEAFLEGARELGRSPELLFSPHPTFDGRRWTVDRVEAIRQLRSGLRHAARREGGDLALGRRPARDARARGAAVGSRVRLLARARRSTTSGRRGRAGSIAGAGSPRESTRSSCAGSSGA